MTRGSIQEYADAVRERYRQANKREKGRILDEFCQTTKHHRKAAIRLLSRPSLRRQARRGRPDKYQPAVIDALKTLWQASNHICSKRLVPFIPELLDVLERHGELKVEPELRDQLLTISEATANRRLKPFRHQGLRRPYSQSRSCSAIKAQVPIRTFGDWEQVRPGSLQADLVAHCGDSTEGFYLTSLVAVDVATGWTECEPIWGKNQQRVGTGMHHVRQRLPVALRELHTDNGGEFLNQILYPWCRREGISFTRGRPYKKNDQAYAEQKNWSVVRQEVGYDRYATKAAYEQLGRVYQPLRLYVNFFQPIRMLIGKERVGAKVRKLFDKAQTPYQRLLASGVLEDTQRQSLEQMYRTLNPVELRRQTEKELEALWKLADRPEVATKAFKAPS